MKGQSLIELLIAVGIFVMITAVVGLLLIDGFFSHSQAGQLTKAVFLAQEGLEAVRSIRDNDWNALNSGEFGLAISGNSWIFSGNQEDVSSQLNQGVRKIIIESLDSDRRKVTSLVSWEREPVYPREISFVSYLTNWQKIGIGNWANPQREAGLNIAGSNNGLKIQAQGDFAYMVRDDGSPDFLVINIANPANPSIVGSLNLSGAPRDIKIAGNYAYVASADNNQELQIINISNPSLPVFAGFYNAAGSADANGIFVSGATAYLARASSASNEFLIINAFNPNSPQLTGSLDLGGTAYKLFISGNYAYVASGRNDQEMQIVDISNPALPVLAGSVNLSGTADAQTIAGFGSTIIAGRGNLVYLFDISVPTAPVQIGSFNYQGTVNDLSLGNSNKYLFAGTSYSNNEFQIIDISSPASPFLLGAYNVAGANPLRGVFYQATNDRVFAVGDANSEEFIVLAPQ